MTPWTLVEPFCGSGALSMAVLGARSQLLPYQGSKWHVRKQLQALLIRLGYWGEPEWVILSDVAPWAVTVAEVLRNKGAVLGPLGRLVQSGEQDPEGTYASLHRAPVPSNAAQRAAELLWLQRMSFNGKAVGAAGDGLLKTWRSPGFNTTSAKGTPATDKFGAIRPLGQALLQTVSQAPSSQRVLGVWGELDRAAVARDASGQRLLVYMDPPYEGTAGYPDGDATRAQVIEQAEDWARLGATVIVSEAVPVAGLGPSWVPEKIFDGRNTADEFQTSGAEWVTVHRGRSVLP